MYWAIDAENSFSKWAITFLTCPWVYRWRLEICIKWCIVEMDGNAVLKKNQVFPFYYMDTVGECLLWIDLTRFCLTVSVPCCATVIIKLLITFLNKMKKKITSLKFNFGLCWSIKKGKHFYLFLPFSFIANKTIFFLPEHIVNTEKLKMVFEMVSSSVTVYSV